LWEAIERYAGHVQHVLCTDVAKDGAMQGPNLALYKEAVRRFPGLQWQASGGVRDVEDLRALAQTGVVAAVSGRALLEGRLNEKELQPFLPSASSPA
jgi:phosphoribosylformimino-5-aminoimidazole carboxamide ribotide isomerase